jgi:hypothetical protein
VAKLIEFFGRIEGKQILATGKKGAFAKPEIASDINVKVA